MAVSSSGSRLSLGDVRRGLVRLAWFVPELLVFFAFFYLYFLGRGWQDDRIGPGLANAANIINVEQALGIFVEADWQRWAMNHGSLMDAANVTYSMFHMQLLYVMGFVFFLVNGRKHRVLRNSLLLSGFLAMPFYWWFPVAPPRLLDVGGMDYGFVDSVESLRGSKAEILTNNYAAVPSYHFGWILLLVFGVWWVFQSPLFRAVAVAFLAWMSYCIVVTANHYFLDMAAGGVMVTIAFLLAMRWERWISARPHIESRWFFKRGDVRLPF